MKFYAAQTCNAEILCCLSICWRSNGWAVHGPSLTERLQITHGLTHTVECRLLIYLLIYINISDSSNIVLHVDRYIRPCVDHPLFILIFWYLLRCYLHYTVLNNVSQCTACCTLTPVWYMTDLCMSLILVPIANNNLAFTSRTYTPKGAVSSLYKH